MAIEQFTATELVTRTNVNARITQANDYFPVTVANGGTGGITATAARTNLDVYTPVLLYENSQGNEGTVVISDSAANYLFLDINVLSRHCVRLYNPNGFNCLISYVASDGDAITWIAKTVTVNGTTISISRHISGYTAGGSSVIYTDKGSKIFRVIGYKH